MNNKLRKKFDRLENTRLELMENLEKFGETALSFQPHQDKWSIIQVIHHLNKSEQLSVAYINKKLQYRTNIKNSGIAAVIRSFLLKLALRSSFRFKAPKFIADVPKTDTFESIKDQWEQTRMDIRKLLDKFPDEFLDKNIFKHAFAGKMNIYQMLNFMQDHFDHHLKQIGRIRKKLTIDS
ncbi:MAG: DinB family protein [Bacteroidetes bacterium]|nr:DinB family protein [Bacteroidota bacterium]